MLLLSAPTSNTRDWQLRERFSLYLVVLLLMAFKSNDALTNPQFWAEDGRVFFSDQFEQFWPQIFTPYAGYLLAIPRLIAWVASWMPAENAPLIYNASAIMISAAAIVFTCQRLRFYLPPWIVALSFLAVPTNGEIFGTLTNVQWFLQFFLAVCCLTPAIKHSKRPAIWMRTAGIFLIALTGPFSVLLMLVLAGLAALSVIAHRSRIDPFNGALSRFLTTRDWHSIAAAAGGAVIQGVVIATSPAKHQMQHEPLWVLETTFKTLLPPHIFGSDFLTGTSWLILYAIILLTIVLSSTVNGESRLMLFGFACFAAIECFVPMLRMTNPDELNPFSGDRYFYLIKVVWWWCVWSCLRSSTGRSQTNATMVTTALIALFAIVNIERLQRAPFKDFEWKAHAKHLKDPGPHSIPINPYDWRVEVRVPQPTKEE